MLYNWTVILGIDYFHMKCTSSRLSFFHLQVIKMSKPHTAHSLDYWEHILKAYARGHHRFGRGEQPPKQSDVGKKLARINCCPAHNMGRGQRTLFSRTITCSCGYHLIPKRVSDCIIWVAINAHFLQAKNERKGYF